MYSVKLTLSLFAILGLILASCAPAAAPTTPTAKPAAPAAQPTPKPALSPVPQPPAPTAKPAAPTPSPKPAAEQPRSGGVLAISAQGDPFSLDIHQDESYLVGNVVQLAYNGVTQFDPNSPETVIGDLAKSWEISKDGLTYTFKLNENVKFHDGTPFTAEDVKISYDRLTNPPRGIRSPRRIDLIAVDKLDTVDKNTFRFTLKYPSSAFLGTVSSGFMAIFSRAFLEKKTDMKFDFMGTGPYRLKAYSTGVSLEYVKFADYFVKGRPYLNGITFYIIKDAGTRLAAFRTGQVKLTGPGASGLTAADAEIIRKTLPQVTVLSYPSFSRADFLPHNQRKPWTDIRVRKAAHLAIDRQKAIEVLDQGYGELGSHMPGKWGIPQDELLKIPGWRQPKEQDIAEAKRLLAEAGFPQGFSMKSLVRAEKQFEDLTVFVADQLAKIGIKLELDIKDPAVRTELLRRGDFEVHPRIASLSFPDPDNVARYWAPPSGDDWGTNWQRAGDEKTWELFDKQARSIDPAERAKIVRELDLRMIDQAMMPIIYWRNAIMGWWPEVRNRGKVSGYFSFQKYQDIWLAK
ncbi:MAG: ABC transporter substrate-binding protein [Chloroflexi bacterium]|nr:ABC transporter substrate-binding protein [Chloroflexota bacterium]